MNRSPSSNTFTFMYLVLNKEIKKNSQPYVCQCVDCESGKYAKFCQYMEDKENKKPSNTKGLVKRKSMAFF